jgi:hypothetical protein
LTARLIGSPGFVLSPGGEDGEKSVAVTTFPWSDVYHEVRWWISKPLTIDEWGQLDDEESELLSKIVGDHFSGTAGPMPFGEEWQKAREEWDRAGKVQDESP